MWTIAGRPAFLTMLTDDKTEDVEAICWPRKPEGRADDSEGRSATFFEMLYNKTRRFEADWGDEREMIVVELAQSDRSRQPRVTSRTCWTLEGQTEL